MVQPVNPDTDKCPIRMPYHLPAVPAYFHDTFYYVSDMPRAVAFYRDLLGMRVVPEDTFARWTTLKMSDRSGETPLGLFSTDGQPVPTVAADPAILARIGATITLAFSPQEFEAQVAILRAAQVSFPIEVNEQYGYPLCVIADPDQNHIMLIAPPQKEPS